jgi:hypothetical protein
MGKKIRIRDEHPRSFFRELRNSLWVKILHSFMRIWVRDLFDLDPGWKNSGPGSGLNIPDRNIGVNE